MEVYPNIRTWTRECWIQYEHQVWEKAYFYPEFEEDGECPPTNWYMIDAYLWEDSWEEYHEECIIYT
jgi:hypothetical protein